jgi:hypothetical protein
MDMPKPGPGHKRLEMMTGTWEGEETMHPSQWDPKGGTATGRTRTWLALGGFAAIFDYDQERDGKITFTGHGVTTFDPKQDVYVLHWFDCMGSPPEVFTGRFEGDVLTLAHGGPMHARMTYDYRQAGKLASKMEMSQDGSDWKTLFDAVYTRS